MPIVISAPKPAIRLSVASRSEARIVFFGTPLFAVPSLHLLVESGWPIAAVVTAPDKPAGRRMVTMPSPVKTAALELGLDVLTPVSLRDESFQTAFDASRPDICVVVAYGKLIPKHLLSVPRLGFLNVHPSLLPEYRGPSPVQTAILDGRTETGVSIMMLDAQMDHGPVVTTAAWTIPSGFDAQLCEEELSRIGAKLLVESLPGYVDGTLIPRSQNHTLATYTTKYSRADGRIDWNQPAEKIVNKIRALGANPGTWTLWNGATLNIIHAHGYEAPIPVGAPGSVFLQGSELVVRCGTGAVAIEVLQLEGSTKQSARDFRNGHQGIVGGMLV